MAAVRALRYRYPDGRVQAVLPMHVVEEDSARIVGWTPPGTQIMFWATEDGRDPRDVPVHERFHQRLGTAERQWTGAVLRVIPYDQPFQVLHFWSATGAFAGWYVNLETPKRRAGAFIDSVDLHLDLVISIDRSFRWKDAEEALAALGTEYLDCGQLVTARQAVEHILDNVDGWPEPIGDWTAFRPQPAWQTPLDLPPGWSE